MKWTILLIAAAAAFGQEAPPAPTPAPVAASVPIPPAPDPSQVDSISQRELAGIRRVFVDHLTGGQTAAQMREILLSTLEETKLFAVTEKEERADAVLRGGAEDLVYVEAHNSSDGVNARMDAGSGRASSTSRGAYMGMGLGTNESDHSSERRHEAIAAVRLVNKDGDVIWATVQESLGAKFRGASADVAEKITAKLKEDLERARKK
jgi:hypothetical protein